MEGHFTTLFILSSTSPHPGDAAKINFKVILSGVKYSSKLPFKINFQIKYSYKLPNVLKLSLINNLTFPGLALTRIIHLI